MRQLFEAIRTAACGGTAMPSAPPRLLEAAITALTPGDRPILRMLMERAPLRDIAANLEHSPEQLHRRIAEMLAALRTTTPIAS